MKLRNDQVRVVTIDVPEDKMGRWLIFVLLCGVMMGLSGCHRRPQLAPLPPVLKPVELVDNPKSEDQPLLEVPEVKLPPVPIAAAAARPPRERRRSSLRAAQPSAPVTPPAAVPAQPGSGEKPVDSSSVLGSLTVGGDSNPQNKQEAADLIASVEKRLNAQPTETSEEKKAQINKVRNFLRDAQEALKSSDADGAKTLATKAKVLLDDME